MKIKSFKILQRPVNFLTVQTNFNLLMNYFYIIPYLNTYYYIENVTLNQNGLDKLFKNKHTG